MMTMFDMMFNKNPFGLAVKAAGAMEYPAPGQTARASLPCAINKKFLDGKNPPKFPFMIQSMIRSSYDVFMFNVPCILHCLIDLKTAMTQEEFKKFWGMI